ncbi:S-layer homology domain-containing protein [Calothrix sp. NIES-2098]|uniref:S-layer homology domain-containing protein n=1 Tax=Calothrix sp. NIES-2098 TaxID=1954171 RepID=UPI000B62113E|nr:S-layer domain-containing protein [Calothrix sp. NIES-2098]
MINTPPPAPESSPNNALGFDEFIAVLVAFSAIGAILLWSLFRKDSGWNLSGVLSPTASPSVQRNLSLSSPIPQTQPNAGTLPSSLPTPSIVPPAIEETPPTDINPAFPTQQNPPVSSSSRVITQPFSLVTPSKKKSTIPPPIAFNDVPADFWGQRFINVLSSRGIIKGFPDYSFRPNQPVKRAEFAAILQQAFENQSGKNTLKFKDVKAEFWANSAINQAISAGFLKGYPNQTFQPEQKISRVQVLVALVSGLNLKTPASPEQVLKIYQDAKDIPKYATAKIASATANGLVVNYPDPQIFAPNKEATRAEVTAMVYQALVKMGQLEAIPSQNIVR